MSEKIDKFELSGELREVEAVLREVLPARGRLGVAGVMLEAGRVAGVRAGRIRERMWMGVCGVLLLSRNAE